MPKESLKSSNHKSKRVASDIHKYVSYFSMINSECLFASTETAWHKSLESKDDYWRKRNSEFVYTLVIT